MPPKKEKKKAQLSKQKGFKVGKIIFSDNMPSIKRQILQKLGKKVNLNGFRWELINHIFIDYRVSQIFQYCLEIHINHLGLANNQHPTILKQINIIKLYQKLQTLILPQNMVVNIQQLQFLNAPLLGRLDVRDNQITHLKCIKKLSFPKLDMFVFGNNHIKSVGTLNQANFPNVFWYDFTQNPKLNDFQSLIKGCNQQLQHCYLQCCSVVNPKILKNNIRFRWPNPNLYIKTAMEGANQVQQSNEIYQNQHFY